MKVAIMQPYLFPYIGYFQLIDSVDKFVVFNDVNYIKRGWLNRNRILLNETPHSFTFPVAKPSQNRKILEHQYFELSIAQTKFLKTIEQAYKQAPYYDELINILNIAFSTEELGVDQFNQHCLKVISNYLGIETEFLLSSELNIEKNTTATQRIIDICQFLGATEYINLPGGKDLYHPKDFQQQGIEIDFIVPSEKQYSQKSESFHPYLSILDVIAYKGNEATRLYR